MVETLGPLPARPPTPPRPGPRIDQNQELERTPITAQTPGDTPQQAHSSRAPPSSRGSKRVTFSPWLHTEIHSPWNAKSTDVKESPHHGSPLSSDVRPFKSILKETGSPIPVWSPNVDKFTTESLDMLLESVIQQLAGESISSRLDAYMQFFGALRTYDGIPSGRDVAEKLGMITGFIQRDVNRDLINGAPLDTNLANQALKLSAAFVWHNDISTLLPEDFKVFIVEHAITCLQEGKIPKSVLTHYMSILSTQNFGIKIMNNTRVTRLLTALQDVTNHVTGKAIALHRLSIYQRLFVQSKSTFVSQASLWIEQLIFGLLHPMKDNRLKAIALGFQIALTMGPNLVLSKSIRELFDRPLEKDRKLVTEIRERMSRMIATLESGVHVPQIWSIIILLLRNKSRSLDQWDHFKEWVLVLQKCFNCSEPAIKAQAIIGWNRFVNAVGPGESTSRSLLKMLGKPVLSQFERKKAEKSGSSTTSLALASYHNLIYYAFRPSPSHQYLDSVWEEYVSFPFTSIFSTSPALSDSASRVLVNLLWASQAKVWTEDRVNDSTRIEAEELPSVDPRWVRSRAASVVRVFESLLKSSLWNEDHLEKSNIALAWTSFSSAMSVASNKEITPSGESVQAIASVLGLLNRLWSTGPSSLNAVGDNSTDIFFERFRFLSTTMISSLGGICFTEKLLIKTTEETFQTATTPTRDSTAGTTPDSPILHLLRTVSSTGFISTPTSSYTALVNNVVEAACKSKISRGSRLELLRQCANLATIQVKSTFSTQSFSAVVWKASAGAAADALQSFPIESSRERDGSVSRDYENISKILAAGVQISTAFPEWAYLLESFIRVVRTEKGDRALATLVVEPVAESLASLPLRDTYFPATALLNHSMSIPFMQDSSLTMETVSQQEIVPPFPFKFMDVIEKTLQSAYETFNPSETHGLPGLLESLTSLLGSGIPTFRVQTLEFLQIPLALWIKDEHSKVDFTRGADSRIMTACRALSSAVINVLQTSVPDHLTALQKFEIIICAGLESPHQSRNNRFVDFWSSTASSADPSASQTSMGQSLAKAAVASSSNAGPQDEISQDLNYEQPINVSAAPQYNDKRHSTCASQARSANLNSSPVVHLEQQPSFETTESNDEPQLPANSQEQVSRDSVMEDAPTVQPQANRREMFKMIESIRSSSPANTPGKSGYETPVHLRRFQASNAALAIPLTPTLAPTENYEGFIGSSPTPATRDPTPATNKEFPVLKVPEITMADSSDLPSSPPEVTSRSPSPQKQRSKRPSRKERARAAKAKRSMLQSSGEYQNVSNGPAKSDIDSVMASAPSQPEAQGESKEIEDVPQVDERPPSRRTRSALGQSFDNSPFPVPPVTVETPGKSKEAPATQTPQSKSASKRKRTKNAARSARNNRQRSEQASAVAFNALVPPEQNMDSSSEEMETQIASQLEQDLESAVDIGSHIDIVGSIQPAEEQSNKQISKKRKREEDGSQEARTANAKERRRSTRLTSTKDEAQVDVENTEPDTLQDLPQNTAANLETNTPRRSTRSSQRKDEPVTEESLPATQVSESQDPVQESVPPQPSSKRSRKSLRLEDQHPTSVPEEVPTRSKSQRSRSSRSTRNGAGSQDQHTEADSQPSQNQLDSQEVVPESIITEGKSAMPEPSLVPTEQAPDSQNTAKAAQLTISHSDVQAMDLDGATQEDSMLLSQPTTSILTTEVQNEPSPILETGTSETGITSALQRILGDMKTTTLSPDALRQVDDLLFNIRVAAHDASRRTLA